MSFTLYMIGQAHTLHRVEDECTNKINILKVWWHMIGFNSIF